MGTAEQSNFTRANSLALPNAAPATKSRVMKDPLAYIVIDKSSEKLVAAM
jgi:hypothetical protein